MDQFRDASGADISGSGDHIKGRLGLRATLESSDRQMRGIFQADILKAFKTPTVKISGHKIDMPQDASLRLTAGYESTINKALNLNAQIAYESNFKRDADLSARLNLQYRF